MRKKTENNFYQDKFISSFWWSGLLLNLGVWSALRFTQSYSSLESLNLHYTIYFGIDRIGSWWELWIIPGVALIIQLFNFGLAKYFYRSDILISRIIAAFSLVIHIVSIGGVWVVVLLN